MAKILLKQLMAWGVRSLGRTGLLDPVQSWIEQIIVPRLLDPRSLSTEPRLVRLRTAACVICAPHIRTHWTPYWFGRLYEYDLQQFLERVLKPGDCYVDIGMNYGHYAFLAGYLVGPSGSVEAFEPNPKLARLVRQAALGVVKAKLTVQETALGAKEGCETLSIPTLHSGGATLLNSTEVDLENTVSVQVVRGDSVLHMSGSRAIVKIDVEGFEPNVVAGLTEFLRARAQAVVVEVTPEWIGGLQGVVDLFNQLSTLGFIAWVVRAGPRLVISRCNPTDVTMQTNVYFMKNGFEIESGLVPPSTQ